MKPRQIAIQALTEAGYVFKRHGGSHDMYFNRDLKCTIPLKRHDFDEGDLRYISREIRDNRRLRGE